MFSDDFLRVIAFQARRPPIPAHRVTRRVQLKNGVFLDALNEQTKPLFALTQRTFRSPPVREVFKSDSQKIKGQREYPDGVNAFSDPLIPVGNLTQIHWLLSAESLQTRDRQRRFQELGKIGERFAAKVFQGCPR